MSLLSINTNEKLVLKANFPEASQDRIFMFKLISLKHQFNDDYSKDYYIAVPNGKSVSVKNLPSGEYDLSVF